MVNNYARGYQPISQLTDNYLADIQQRAAQRRPNPAPVVTAKSDIPERATLDQLDTSHHPLVAEAVAAARQWQATRRRQIAEYRRQWGIPPEKVLDYYEPARSSLVLMASQFRDAKGRPVEGRTGYGCGKTHIARAVLWSIFLSRDGVPTAPVGKFFGASQLILELDPEGQGRYIEAMLRNCPLLVIDDVGNKGTEQEIPFIGEKRQGPERQARYYAIINYCYERGIGVVITSNLDFTELREHIGGRAYSRLTEMAPDGQWVNMTGVPDYRLKLGGRK